ncbi:DNA-directed RNA polymerase III subunit rpc5 [Mycena sanguinolenta]|uniref:DNA-directed RNA polymerase III subunit rpc5 n=1 Tax=Mycena sanguinolenta TaxID=230812 RepID=A0A8H6XE16_9AGAR|nr:DNA-directed RNA polymerase III subunit rpc5 [Mycena sanguinolenta]
MELFHKVMKDELCYTTAITVTTVILALLLVFGVNFENGLDIIGWVSTNWAIISVLVIHSFGRVIHRHEKDALFQNPSAWWHERDVPPSAAASGKRITARLKPSVPRLEIHVPSDTRPEVWNSERGREFGAARVDDDREKNQESKGKAREGDEPRLSEVRMRSEQIQQKRRPYAWDSQLHLHPISETHQLRPTLTYLDILSRKNKRSRAGGGSDSDSDDGPPPDPDEPAPPPAPKKEKKPTGEAREVQVTARKSEDKGNLQQIPGGPSAARREMLIAIRSEEDESWQDLEFHEVTTVESETIFEGIFSQSDDVLETKTDITAFLKDISGL